MPHLSSLFLVSLIITIIAYLIYSDHLIIASPFSNDLPLCNSFVIRSKNVILSSKVPPTPYSIHVSNGKIIKISAFEDAGVDNSFKKCRRVITFDSQIVMPGLIDTHVHMNEPGLTHWEGFSTATMAAAAGGHTFLLDMPLNSLPPTISVKNLKEKIKSAKQPGKLFIDVGFLAGVIPENINELSDLIKEGVFGFKSFMCPSGVDEFPPVNETTIQKALEVLKGTNLVYMVHAEVPVNVPDVTGDPEKYMTYLATRPEEMEVEAVKKFIQLCKNSNVKCHIVHVASPKAAKLIEAAKKEKDLLLTSETCTHYLYFFAEEIPNGATHYKCAPPIRESEKREELWNYLKKGVFDFVTSDHSPSPSDMKSNNYLQSWGGIASLQYGLPALWTEMSRRHIPIQTLVAWKSEEPAKLLGFEKTKGMIEVGYDADFVVWDAEEAFIIREEDCYHRHKKSPFTGHPLKGKVRMTILRGNIIYFDGKFPQGAIGQIVKRL